jgi:methyl-accepting chemotaxis protein
MTEQSTAVTEISTASASMRQQSDQAAKALGEQTRAMRDVVAAATNTSKQIKLIHRANREHSTVAGGLLQQVADVRRIAERNAAGMTRTRGSLDELEAQARALGAAVAGVAVSGAPGARAARAGR